jgi:predicted DNA-binding helix-hairpin-helix protein
LGMFEKTEEERLETAQKQASRQKVNVDRPKTQTLNENAQDQGSQAVQDPMGYMNELNKF